MVITDESFGFLWEQRQPLGHLWQWQDHGMHERWLTGFQLSSSFYCCFKEGLALVVQGHGALPYVSISMDTQKRPWETTKQNLENVYDSMELLELASSPVLQCRHLRVGVVFVYMIQLLCLLFQLLRIVVKF